MFCIVYLTYSLNKKEWIICSLFKEWILEKSEIRVNLEWTFVLFTHFGVTTGIVSEFIANASKTARVNRELRMPSMFSHFPQLPPPPPPLRGRRDRMRVPKIAGKGVLFVRQSPAREKKGGYLTFTRRFLLKRGGFSFSFSLEAWEFNKGGYKIKYRGYIEQCFGFRGVSKAGKACEKPAKGGFRNCVSPEIGGAFKGREHAYAYPK